MLEFNTQISNDQEEENRRVSSQKRDINRIAREDVALQCFEEGARGKSGGFLV